MTKIFDHIDEIKQTCLKIINKYDGNNEWTLKLHKSWLKSIKNGEKPTLSFFEGRIVVLPKELNLYPKIPK